MNPTVPSTVLFVCMGNICRSPTAEGVLRKLAAQAGVEHCLEIDSAGTHAYHVGEGPDRRAIAAASTRGVDISNLTARQVVVEDFYRFDYILALDSDNLLILEELQPSDGTARLSLLLAFSALQKNGSVPDPYYGGAAGFEQVLDLLEEANQALLTTILSAR